MGLLMIEDAMQTGLAGMAQMGNPRVPMDKGALAGLVNASANYTSHGIDHPRYSQPAMDPAYFPVARPLPALQTGENGGARYGIRVGIPILTMPEAGATQANGRIIRSQGRTGSFYGG